MLALIALLSPAQAQEVGAILTPEVAVDVARDRPLEDTEEVHLRVRAWAEGPAGEDGTWFLAVRGESHILNGGDLEGWTDLLVGESGWEGRLGGPVRLRAGNLRERWGKLDLLPAVDVLNPRDLKSGPMAPQEWLRLEVPMAVLQIGGDQARSETVVLPFAAADQLWLRDTDWSFVRAGMLDDYLEDEVSTWTGGSGVFLSGFLEDAGAGISDLDPSLRRGLDSAVNQNSLPQALWVNGEIAQRFEVEAQGVDAAIMGGYLRNREPLATLDQEIRRFLLEERLPEVDELDAFQAGLSGGPLNVAWPRTWMAGAEVGTVLGAFGLRGEGLYLSRKTVRRAYSAGAVAPQVGGGLGIDWARGSTVNIAVEGRYLKLIDPPQDMILTAEDSIVVGGGTRLALLQDRLTITLGGAYDISFEEYLLSPSVAYRVSDPVELELGAIVLGGATPPPATLEDAFTYTGGPASYWSQNDAFRLAVSWIL